MDNLDKDGKAFGVFRVVIVGGVFTAVSATILSGLFVAIFFLAHTGLGAEQRVVGFLVVCLFALVPAGTFGFVAGALGTAWLSWRRAHIHSKSRLLGEAAVAGVVLAFPFPFFHRAMGWTGSGQSALDPRAVFLSLGVGIACAILFPLTFSHFFLSEDASVRAHTRAENK